MSFNEKLKTLRIIITPLIDSSLGLPSDRLVDKLQPINQKKFSPGSGSSIRGPRARVAGKASNNQA